jgi:hypothetical protein
MTARTFSVFREPILGIGRTQSSWFRALFLVLIAMTVAGSASAQIIYGSIVGSVTDGTGAVIPNAQVTVTQTETNLVRKTKSDSAGVYKVSTLPAGIYTVDVTASGFNIETVTHVSVIANSDVRADAVLKVGATTSTVSVNDAIQSLQTDRADVSTQLSSREVGDLPIAGRNFQSLLGQVPGVLPTSDNVGQGSVNNPARSQTFNGNGSNGTDSNVAIEGVSSANSWITNLSSYVPAEDSIQSVDIVTGSFNAEQGTAGGVSVNVQLKSGSNAFHGTAFEQYTAAILEAKPRFNFAAGGRNPQLNEHQYGGTIGGPIFKDKLFFFVSAEQLSDHETQINTFSVPTISDRQGYFRYTGTKAAGGNGLGIYDPTTGSQVDGSGRSLYPLLTNPAGCTGCAAGQYYYINPLLWNSATTAFLAAIPAPNLGDTSVTYLQQNYRSLGKYTYRSTKIDAKLDYNLSGKLHLNYRLSLLPFKEVVPSAYCVNGTPCTAAGPPTTYIGQPGPTTGDVSSNSLSGIYTFSPKLVVDANIGYTYLMTGILPPLYGTNYCSTTLGVPNCDGPDPINSGVPQINIYGLNAANGRGAPFGNWYSAIHNHNPNHTVQANVTWSKGDHSMRFGGNYSEVLLNIAEDLFGYGDLEFNGGSTSSNGIANGFQDKNAIADFLLGETYKLQKRILNTTYMSLRTTGDYLYAQDQWQVNKKLTFNYGVRWNLFPVPHRAHSGIELFDPLDTTPDPVTGKQNFAGKISVCGRGSVASNCGIIVSKKLFSPLMGIAYRVDEKTVFRAGGGINYNQDSMFRDGLENFPSQTVYSVNNNSTYFAQELATVGYPATLEQHTDLTQASYVLPAGVTNSANLQPGNFKRGYTESWNVTFERQFGLGWTGQIGYVASQVVHGQSNTNLNVSSTFGTPTIKPNQTGSGTCATAGACTIQPVSAPARAYQATLGNNGYSVESPFLHSTYNSMQTTLKHNFRQGYSVTANYTWSRHIGTSGTPFVYAPYLPLDRQLQGDDRKNNFNFTLLGELPFGKGKAFLNTGIPAAIAGGWQFNSIVTIISGSPITLSANAGFNSSGVGSNWADRVKNGSGKGHASIFPNTGNIIGYLDPSQFADPNTDCSTYNAVTQPYCPLRFGTNNSFNALRGPGIVNVDSGLSRKFRIREGMAFKFTVDVFNLTNTPHLGSPSSNISNYNSGDPTKFGQISSVNSFGGRFGLDQRQFKLGGSLSF